MNAPALIRTFSCLCALLLVLASQAAGAIPEKLRVLSMDLGLAEITTAEASNQITQQVRQMLERADPDLICLQGVRDWETSQRVAELRPGFRVLICSGFAATADGSPGTPQVAILGRNRARLSWVEELSGGQAFAYALVEAGQRKLGVFSIQSPEPRPAGIPAVAERVLAEVSKLQGFQQNRPEAILVVGTGLASHPGFAEAAFQTATLSTPAGTELHGSAFWVWQAGLLSLPRAVPIRGLPAPVLVADVDAANAFASKFAYQKTLLFPGETAPPGASTPATGIASSPARQWLWPVVVLLVGVLLGVLIFGGRRGSAAVQVLPPGGNPGAVLPPTGLGMPRSGDTCSPGSKPPSSSGSSRNASNSWKTRRMPPGAPASSRRS